MSALSFFIVTLFLCSVLGNDCPRTNKRPRQWCADECLPSLGCRGAKKVCLCDGDCGYSCVKKNLKCRPFKLQNGKLIGNGTHKLNDTLEAVCNGQHTLFGSRIRRCRGNEKYDGRKPRCKIACRDPGIPDYSNRDRKVNRIGFRVKTTLIYYCFPGHKATTPLRITCGRTRKWSSPAPICKPKDCGRAKLPKNSEVSRPRNWRNSATHPYGKRIILGCKPGYQKVGYAVMICRDPWNLLTSNFRCVRKSCGDPGTPKNGKKNGLSFAFGDRVHYSCDYCYTRNGASYRQCSANGKWSDILPSCIRVECRDPGNIANGDVIVSSKPMYCNSFVDYKCSTGYNLKGVARRTCKGDGKWSSDQPKCEIVNCGDPGNPKHGKTTADKGFTYQQDIWFSCDNGYVMSGNSIATCQVDGRWSKDLPTCLEKCSDPKRSTNARLTGNEFYHGKEVKFDCALRDYVLVPQTSSKLTCNNGKWNGRIPSCKAPCSRVGRIRNGVTRLYGSKHGAHTSFYCRRGYKLIGSSRIDCNDGKWTNSVPKCSAICRKIAYIRNGRVDGKGYLEGDKLSFRCDQDYILDGEKTLTCRSDRRWSANQPKCKAPCSKIRDPAHGKITRQGYKHNEQVHVECDLNYVLDGRRVLTCNDGTWSSPDPRCLAPCSNISTTPFLKGYTIQNGFQHNEIVTFGCQDPFVLDGPYTLRCLNGRWDKLLPTCGAPCKPLGTPTNGRISSNGYRHKDTTTFACNRGYKLTGEPNHLCNFGRWSENGKIPICKAICRQITRLTNGFVNGRRFEEGDQLSFRCFNGYVLEGAQTITCQQDTQWSSSMPVCKAICKQITQLRNGYVVGKGNKQDEQLKFECLQGYALVGASTITCEQTGRWSAAVPICKATCSQIAHLTNGKVIGAGNHEGDHLRFQCDHKHALVGKQSITCLRDGSWSDNLPVCKATCIRIKNYLKNGRVIGAGNNEGDHIRFECDDNYALVGKQSITCYPDGKWSGNLPVCKAICSSIKYLRNGKVIGAGNYEGDQLSFQCDDNYTLFGKQSITCYLNGMWSDNLPVCKDIKCPNITHKLKAGKVEGKGLSPGDKRRYTCKPYFNLNGAEEITCLKSGQWDKDLPTCKLRGPVKNCSVVTGINGGYAKRNESHHGGKVVFKCLANHIMDGEKMMRCVAGSWTRNKPKCYAPCKDIGSPKNGVVKKTGTKHKGTIAFACDDGFTLTGSKILECDDGRWNHNPPTCDSS